MAAFVAVPAAAKTISVKAGTPDANEKLQEALILAEPGDTVELGAGVWKLTDGLSLDVDGLTEDHLDLGDRDEHRAHGPSTSTVSDDRACKWSGWKPAARL